ncbi:hypothetical protein C8Q77DRAFT_254753 [Trametes polyzona]|nr:hypothetical protein C8Q77DRAFT_254753 [Trametes polyzona]
MRCGASRASPHVDAPARTWPRSSTRTRVGEACGWGSGRELRDEFGVGGESGGGRGAMVKNACGLASTEPSTRALGLGLQGQDGACILLCGCMGHCIRRRPDTPGHLARHLKPAKSSPIGLDRKCRRVDGRCVGSTRRLPSIMTVAGRCTASRAEYTLSWNAVLPAMMVIVCGYVKQCSCRRMSSPYPTRHGHPVPAQPPCSRRGAL